MKLYELSKELAVIQDEIVTAEGDITPELEKRLDECSLGFLAKTENIGKWLVNLGAREEAVDKEIERLAHRKKVTQNLQKRLKEYMKFCMELAGKTKVEFPGLTLTVVKNPPSIEIKDEHALPSKYIQIVQQITINKKALLDDLKAGMDVEGAVLVTDRTHLRVK